MDANPPRRRFPLALSVGLAIAAGIVVALAIDVGAQAVRQWLARHHLTAPYLAAASGSISAPSLYLDCRGTGRRP